MIDLYLPVQDVLECVPPALAIWFEKYPIPTKHSIASQAKSFVEEVAPSGPANLPVKLQEFTQGALSFYSIVPTALAVVSTFLTFHSNTASILAVFAVIAAAATVPYVIELRRFDELGYKRKKEVAPGKLTQISKRTTTEYISLSIRWINGFLILAILTHSAFVGEHVNTLKHVSEFKESSLDPFVFIEALILFGGAILLLFGRGMLTKGIGALAVITALALAVYLHIINLTQFPSKTDEGHIDAGNGAPLPHNLNLQIEKLATLGPFRPNEVTLDDTLRSALEARVCKSLSGIEQKETESVKLLIIVGGVDRSPIGASARRRFGSDMGLAQARAEAVSAELSRRCTAYGHPSALTLVNGPRITDDASNASGSNDISADRSVDVWVVWKKAAP